MLLPSASSQLPSQKNSLLKPFPRYPWLSRALEGLYLCSIREHLNSRPPRTGFHPLLVALRELHSSHGNNPFWDDSSLSPWSSPAAPHPLPGTPCRTHPTLRSIPPAPARDRAAAHPAYLRVGIEMRRGRRGQSSRGVGVARIPKIHHSRGGEVSRSEQLLRRGLARGHGHWWGVEAGVCHGRGRLVGV